IIASMAKGSTRASPRFLLRPLRRMGSPAADKGRNRNATITRVSLAPYALRAGYPSGEKGVKRGACLSLKGEFSPFSL
ncbi:MAG: hypothetical protein LBL79_02350, partial [Prevotella sp.]|nr:hypothetical protein [Prevotella sp.]